MEKIVLKLKTFEQVVYYKTGTGPALLLVHGFPANVQLWRLLTPRLSQHYTVILPDFFESDAYWLKDGSTSMALLADAFKEILEYEQIDKVIWAGHSMGGYMGLCFAGKYPEKLSGLSLIHSSPLGDDEARADGRRKTIKILQNGGKSPFLKKMVRALFPEHFIATHPEIHERQIREALEVNDTSLIAFYKAIMERSDTTEVVRKANFPVQYIVGKLDSLANITKELAAENLANINFVSVHEQGGHMIMLEEPDALYVNLLTFIRFCRRS